uniref:Lipase_3 domain-containing protein n=1 Tax=Parastrongyloides trichosuri TaxID=131310 RepID=A0A0N4ZGS7_PARTI
MGENGYKRYVALYLLIFSIKKHLFIAHKGTENPKQLIAQISRIFTTKKKFLDAGEVFSYQFDAYNATYKFMIEELKKLIKKNKYTHIIFGGHSLGGAVSMLAAYHCIYDGVCKSDKTKVVTFGSPRTGTCDFATKYNKILPLTYRVVMVDDLIPTLPSCDSYRVGNKCNKCGYEKLNGYYHAGIEVSYPNWTDGDYRLCTPYEEDETCNGRHFSFTKLFSYYSNWDYYLKKHVTYFEESFNQTFNETRCHFIKPDARIGTHLLRLKPNNDSFVIISS